MIAIGADERAWILKFFHGSGWRSTSKKWCQSQWHIWYSISGFRMDLAELSQRFSKNIHFWQVHLVECSFLRSNRRPCVWHNSAIGPSMAFENKICFRSNSICGCKKPKNFFCKDQCQTSHPYQAWFQLKMVIKIYYRGLIRSGRRIFLFAFHF